MNELKCVAGCKHFTGGEIKHHKDCPYYPESFSKMYDDLEEKVKKLINEYEKELQFLLGTGNGDINKIEATIDRVYAKAIREFIEKLKNLNEETRKDLENENCDHNWQTIFYLENEIIGRYCPVCKKFQQY